MAPAILFADARFLVIDKPAGLAVHPGRAGGPSVEDFFPAWRRGRNGPWLAHRLDRDTAGCLVVALKKTALLAAQSCFAGGRTRKTYWALVHGVPDTAEGILDLPLLKRTAGRSWRMAGDPAGAAAETSWRVAGRGDGVAWLELIPRTGRTHQIRAHCAALGHPIIGDVVYGGAGPALCLLARAIEVPVDPEIAAVAPVPAHMAAGLRACGHAAG